LKITRAQIIEEELLAKLETMYATHEHLDDVITTSTEERDKIRNEIKFLADRIGSKTERVEIYLDEKGKRGWDRQVKSKPGGGLDVGLLQASLGTKIFNSLVCDRVTQYVFNQDKLEMAVRTGKITEEQIKECTVDAGITQACKRV
jgi:hypothetical protein